MFYQKRTIESRVAEVFFAIVELSRRNATGQFSSKEVAQYLDGNSGAAYSVLATLSRLGIVKLVTVYTNGEKTYSIEAEEAKKLETLVDKQ